MDQRTIQIRLTAKQQEIISRRVSASVASHRGEDCLFPGYRLCIDIVPAFGESASLVLDDEEIDLGNVELTYLPDGP